MDMAEQNFPTQDYDVDVTPSQINEFTSMDNGAARRSRLALIALAFSGLSSVLGFGLITLPAEPVAILWGLM